MGRHKIIKATHNKSKGKRLDLKTKAMIVESFNNGNTYKVVAQEFDVSISTVHFYVKRFQNTGDVDTAKRSGRPRKTDNRTDILLCREVKKNRFVTSTELQSNPIVKSVSSRTIQRRITETQQFKSHWATKKPFISQINRRKRLKWCKDHLNWTKEQWRKVLWSDESPFVFRCNRKRRVWRMANERYKPWCSAGTVKHDKKINVWGCFSANGVGDLYLVEGILKKEQYQTILETHAIPSALRLFGDQNWIFQQDNDPKHTAKVIKLWFVNNNTQILDWPSQSPDLNPIENLWSILDNSLKLRRPNNEQELFQMLNTSWKSISVDTLERLVDSMPARCQAVIDNDGFASKY
jgi:transposase